MDLFIYDKSNKKTKLKFIIEESISSSNKASNKKKDIKMEIEDEIKTFKNIAKIQIDVLVNPVGQLSFAFSLDRFELASGFLGADRFPVFTLKKDRQIMKIKSGIKFFKEDALLDDKFNRISRKNVRNRRKWKLNENDFKIQKKERPESNYLCLKCRKSFANDAGVRRPKTGSFLFDFEACKRQENLKKNQELLFMPTTHKGSIYISGKNSEGF